MSERTPNMHCVAISNGTTPRRAQAEHVASALAAQPHVGGVALFGSVARGTEGRCSDIDLLVLTSQPDVSRQDLWNRLPHRLRSEELTLSVFTEDRLRKYLHKWSRFAVHLQREGVVLFDVDCMLSSLMAEKIDVSVQHELDVQRRKLNNYAHVERFGGRLLFPLGQLYAIGRTVIFASLAMKGHLEFDRETAFRQLAICQPGLIQDIETVAQLVDFHHYVREPTDEVEFPFDPTGPEASLRADEAREAIERILAESEKAEHACY
jgi:predicted nucleotidyltransferase